jgi:hypothetical protein
VQQKTAVLLTNFQFLGDDCDGISGDTADSKMLRFLYVNLVFEQCINGFRKEKRL